MWKHQNNDWYLFKAKIKDAKTNSGVFVVNFKQILQYCSGDTIVGFEQVNVGWVLIPDIPDVLKSLLLRVQQVKVIFLGFHFAKMYIINQKSYIQILKYLDSKFR